MPCHACGWQKLDENPLSAWRAKKGDPCELGHVESKPLFPALCGPWEGSPRCRAPRPCVLPRPGETGRRTQTDQVYDNDKAEQWERPAPGVGQDTRDPLGRRRQSAEPPGSRCHPGRHRGHPSLWTCCLKEEGLWGQSEVSGHPTPAREKAGGPLTSSFIRVSRSFLAAPRMASVFLLGMVSSESLSGKWKTAGGVSARTTLFLDLRRRQAA